jgi:hypothetical protein
MISNCGADHLLGDKRFFCNRLQASSPMAAAGRNCRI